MNKTFVFATTSSRLSADLLIIRLKRVGLSTDKISVLFPTKSQPNSVLCWLGSCLTWAGWRGTDSSLTVAGPLRRYFSGKNSKLAVAERLESTGLADESAKQLEEKLRQGEIVVCVQTANELETSLAWHVYYQMNAESLMVSTERLVERSRPAARPRQKIFLPLPSAFASTLLQSSSWASSPA